MSIATNYLLKAAQILNQRGKDYDPTEGEERSMSKIIEAFNLISGANLTEQQGWLFMRILKMVRLYANTDRYHEDSAIDGIAYAALEAESWDEQFTEDDRQQYLADYRLGAEAYARAIAKGHPAEAARRLLPSGYRQNFTMAGTVQAIFYMLDQRTLADTQIEAQTLAWMALDELERWEPGLFGWYREYRAGRNLLAS
jgi:hypothetical protein